MEHKWEKRVTAGLSQGVELFARMDQVVSGLGMEKTLDT